jgi:uncharacterized repeat protein (TIGR01451 family)
VPPAPHTDLGVVKTVSADVVAPGATVTWNVVGTNHGPGTSTGFILADQLPAGVAFVSATHDAALTCTTPPVGSSGAVTCTAPSVAAGTSLRLEITATVPATTPDGTVLRNVATVNGDQNEPVPDLHPNRDFTDTRVVVPDEPIPEPPNPLPPEPSPVEPPVPPSGGGVLPEQIAGTRLSIHKSVSPSTVRPGGTAVVRLRVKNIGEASAIRVRVCDALPHGIHFVSGAGFTAGGQFVCRNVARIRIGVTRTFTLTVRVSRGARGVRTNRATARALNALRVSARAPIRITTVPSFTG